MLLLAPMANVTDTAFRQIIARCGRPDVMMTEFTSCEGLCSRGRERLLAELTFHPSERPLVVQFFGPRPETFYQCAQLARRLGFDGIDINTGCPDRRVLKQGAGAALIADPGRMREIYAATPRRRRRPAGVDQDPAGYRPRHPRRVARRPAGGAPGGHHPARAHRT